MKYLREMREHFSAVPAFTISDLKVFLGRKGIGRGYLHLLVHNLLAKDEVRRITRGIYTFSSDAQLVGFGFRPFYYGLQDALSLRNLWEQETNPVVLTPRRVRTGVRSFEGTNYLVKRIPRGLFFGFETIKYSGFWIPVSDVEKTLIDFVYFRQALDSETLNEMKKRIKKKNLDGYLRRCPAWVKRKVRELV
jgi:predicted transcriptional regulator of viral defense system